MSAFRSMPVAAAALGTHAFRASVLGAASGTALPLVARADEHACSRRCGMSAGGPMCG